MDIKEAALRVKHLLSCIGMTGVMVTLLLPASALAEKRILKWIDKNGVVHYGDVLPAQASGRGNAELSRQGVVVKKTRAYKNEAELEASKRQSDQLRRDSALLASYSSIEEIDLAMKRNIDAQENLLSVLKFRLNNAQKILDDSLKLQAAKKANGQKPSQYLADKIVMTQTQVDKSQAEIIATTNNIKRIEQRFMAYKARYAELRPRDNALATISVNTRNLSELEAWKYKASQKLNYYLEETVKYKRQGRAVPTDVVEGIQMANREIARANQQIDSIRASIRNSEETFTSK